jgi:ATP-dependent DNA helicase RecG
LVQLISDLRRHGTELAFVEVKAAHRGTPRRLYEPLSAFANRNAGGVLLLGLDETRDFRVVGVQDARRLQEDISGTASKMEPALRPEFTVQIVEGHTVVAVEVPEVSMGSRPCHYKPSGMQAGSFIRVGNTTQRMTDYEIFGYVSARSRPAFDEQPVPEASLDDLDLERVEAYVRDLRQNRPDARYLDQPLEKVLEQLCIARKKDDKVHPTLAGLLTFGEYPQAHEPQLVITFLQFYGSTEDEATPHGERFLDNRKFEGPIPDMVEKAVRHVLASLRKSSLIEGLYRRDIPEYPEGAVREALVNAVVHRDYSNFVRGSYVQVRLFADRLEVQSPGGLYGNVTEETLDTEHSTRNSVLMRLMEDLRIAENRGTGIQAMIRAMREANLEPPHFKDRRSSFWVTFRSHSLMSPEAIAWLNQFSRHPLTDGQRVALVYLRKNPSMTNSDYQRLNHVDSVTATRELRGLVRTSLIRQHGTRGGAYYVLGVAPHVDTKKPPERAEDAVLAFVKKHGSINNAQCRELLAIRQHQAYALLRGMVESDMLRLVGKKRGARYVLP